LVEPQVVFRHSPRGEAPLECGTDAAAIELWQPLDGLQCLHSPDFNPIEQLFAKLKALLRKAAERSVDGLWNRIAALLYAFTPEECANYFRNAGYTS
jgi:hypothetical protein